MASPLRLPAGLITLLAGSLHPTTSATVMPNLCLLCGSYSRLGYSGRCQAPGWSMHLQETYTAWWMASSDEIGQGIRKRGQGGHSCYAAPRWRQSWQASPGDTCSRISVWLVYHIEHTAAFTRRRRRRRRIGGCMLVQAASGRPTQTCQGVQEGGAKALL